MGVLFNSASSAAANGVLSSREVGKLLSKALEDGKLHRGEIRDLKKIQTEMYDELTPAARRAIRNFLSLGNTFEPGIGAQLFGVTDEMSDKLEKADIKSAQDLLLKSKTPDDRANIAGAAGLDEIMVTSLAEQADLARIIGVGPKYAAMLQKVGINDVQELADQNGVALRRQITSFLNTTEGKKITSRRPSLTTVKKWIEGSKALPRMIKHLGDVGADFNKAAFDALPASQKHMLLMGWDVRLDSGFIFDDAALKMTHLPEGDRPAALKDGIAGFKSDSIDGGYESAEMTSVESIEVDGQLLGYRATFEVVSEGSLDAEVASPDDARLRGTVDVTFDTEGKVLGNEEYLDYDYNHE